MMKIHTLLFCVFLMFCGSISAEVKKWVDENGVTHYGDIAPNEDAEKAKLYNIEPKYEYQSGDTYESRRQNDAVMKLQSQFDEAIMKIKSGDLTYESIAQSVLVELRKANVNISSNLSRLNNALLQGTMNSAKFLEQKKLEEEKIRDLRRINTELQAAIEKEKEIKRQKEKERIENRLKNWRESQELQTESLGGSSYKLVFACVGFLIAGFLAFKTFSIFKNDTQRIPTGRVSDKRILPAFLLCFFFGFLGFHRFYVGKVITGVLQLLTLGGLGIWMIIDFIVIIVGAFTDKDGNKITQWT